MDDNGFDLRSLPKCDNLFQLGPEIGRGSSSRVHAVVEKRSGRNLAVKIVPVTPENEALLCEECRILVHLPKHDNIVELYDVYLNTEARQEEIWIVMELCLGTAIDFVRKMQAKDRKVDESHLAYIVKGLLQGMVHLHENHVIHRDIRGSNILITRDGNVRLTDFGISKVVKIAGGKATGRIGFPSWMAPEVIPIGSEYDNKVDVWSMGITAIELAEGKAPFEGVHPSAALFQILRNPPPNLIQPSNRSQLLNDFINECLEKNPENRPVAQEFLEHPLFKMDSISQIQMDIVNILSEAEIIPLTNYPNILIREKAMKVDDQAEEKILHEDLAMLEEVTEESILSELEERYKKKSFATFIGDVLLVLNPNEEGSIYGEEYHKKYKFKARSDNAPHIYAVGDRAYQDVFHHEEAQQIVLTGETMSGKTSNMLRILDHLLFLGQGNKCGTNVKRSIEIIHALGNAATLNNLNSTRHILQTQVSFTDTGKTSGAIFWIYQLEKNRVTSNESNIRNFHIFYYFYYALQLEGNLAKYFLEAEKSYEFLRCDGEKVPGECANRFVKFEENLKNLGFDDSQLKTIRRVLAAILILGEVEFGTDGDGNAKLTTQSEADAIADLLALDQKKFSWALLKYCVIMKGEAAMRYHTEVEAIEAKNVLARGLYFRLVDWIVNCMNEKLSIPRAIYGDKHTVNILDLFGFECSNTNTIDQLLINIMNEQLQYYYTQKMFSWEMKNAQEEEISFTMFQYNDNKPVMDQLLSKPDGLMFLIDEATKTDNLDKSSHITLVSKNEFTIVHYTGTIKYNASEILERNRDFLPPEMIETMRRSTLDNIRKLFTGLLTTTGNLTMHSNSDAMDNREGRWNTGFKATNKNFRGRKFNTSSKGQYSQSRQMRTAATTFRATCLEILRSLTTNESNVQFVRCIRSSLGNMPYDFQRDLIRQQIKAFGVVETVQARKKGFSYRVTFSDFIRRYRFLAFDFNENVEESKDNCRLLFIRLKMEGWVMGKTKVFLKYYDKEYLSRLYGINVRKIVKVQSMMRAFLARRNLRKKISHFQENIDQTGVKNKEPPTVERDHGLGDHEQSEESKEFYTAGNHMEDLDDKTIKFIKPWAKKWRTQSMYQVLLIYRMVQQRRLVYFCQQVHLYNQNNRAMTKYLNEEEINLDKVDKSTVLRTIFEDAKISINKTPFRLSDIPFSDSSHFCSSVFTDRESKDEDGNEEEWDAPLKCMLPKQEPVPVESSVNRKVEDKECQTNDIFDNFDNKTNNNDTKNNTNHNVNDNKNKSSNTIPIQSNTDEVMINVTDIITDQCKDHNGNGSDKTELQKNEVRKPSKYIGIGIKRNYQIKKNDINSIDTQIRNFKNLRQGEWSDQLPKYRTPISELEEKFKTLETTNENDNPPYNFRAMLRKTNYSDDAYQKKSEWSTNTYDFTLKSKFRKTYSIKNDTQATKIKGEYARIEIAPGLIIEGQTADL